MLLSYINDSDLKRERFIELAYKLAYSNMEYPKAQRELLGHYKDACDIEIIPNTSTKQDLIAFFSKESTKVRRIVYFEIYMLFASDGKIDENEMNALKELRSAFDISDDDAEKIQEQGLLVRQAHQDLEKLLCISNTVE